MIDQCRLDITYLCRTFLVNYALHFLEGGKDLRGRTLEEILSKDDEWIEHRHDFIQWLFPLDVASGSNKFSPVLLIDEILSISESEKAQQSLQKSIDRMKAFYMMNDHWIKAYDHNHLRITRIIKSLRLLTTGQKADEFRDWLFYRLGEQKILISDKSKQFWQQA